MSAIKDVVIDFEALGSHPDGMVIDIAAVAFDRDHENPPEFKDLLATAFYAKVDLNSQKGIRPTDKPVKEFWKKQEPAAKAVLKPSDNDVSLEDAIKSLMVWAKANGIHPFKSRMYARGPDYDMGFLENIMRQVFNTRDTYEHQIVKFWRNRDLRTAIEENLMLDMTVCPLRKGLMDGFVKHRSIDDCAAGALQLLYARRYANGLEEPPKREDTDPVTIGRAS